MNAEIVRVIKIPDVQEKIYIAGGEPRSSTPEEFAQVVKRDVAKFRTLILELKIPRL